MLRANQLYELKYHRRGHPVAGRVARVCACTLGDEPSHQWTGQCDRFPELILIRADGTPEDTGPVRAALANLPSDDRIFSAQLITAARHQYLSDLEMWAHAYEPTHPIARPDRRAQRRRSFLDG